ncbi:hypothetical protein GQE98_08860 [Sneathiella sp. DP05]|uniref:Transposase n=1 Tax=Sneathiella litorea TaxID=2606216 RepID=A0A6L8W8A4_9PROT|nr:hypothetical protein [Sneathiella litorea]MZR30743.1 hypothetical protein [Sneathiella litorea]
MRHSRGHLIAILRQTEMWSHSSDSTSLRIVEDLPLVRGIDVCHETVRYWWSKFGLLFANQISKKQILRYVEELAAAG